MKVKNIHHKIDLMDDSFDEMFQEISRHLNDGWRSSPQLDDIHIAVIVFQRTLLEYERSASQEDFEKVKQVRRWAAGYTCSYE